MNISNFLFLLGMLAGALTTIAFIPQVIQAHRSQRTKDVSLLMLVFFIFGLVLWIIYGVLIYARPIVIANLVTLGLVLYLLFLKIKHG